MCSDHYLVRKLRANFKFMLKLLALDEYVETANIMLSYS